MPSPQELIVHPDHDALAAAIAARLITKLLDVQGAGNRAHLCLTGGRGGTSALAATLASPACGAVDWSRVDFWWSDERFLPAGDPERNETGARAALLDHLLVDPAQVHPMPRLDEEFGADVDAAAAGYARQLAQAAPTGALTPVFDVCLLGIGEDAHVASLFPGRTEAAAPESVVAVRQSPKPPPTRTTFTMASIRRSDEVWLIAAGSGKAEAIRLALAGLPESEAPAGAARGLNRTLVLADRDAAALVSTVPANRD